jgi:hypothetical protein
VATDYLLAAVREDPRAEPAPVKVVQAVVLERRRVLGVEALREGELAGEPVSLR